MPSVWLVKSYDAHQGKGAAVKKREDVHRMAKPTRRSRTSVSN